MTLEIADDEAPQTMTPKQTQIFLRKQLARWSYLFTSYGWKFDVIWCANGHEMPSETNRWCLGYTTSQHQYLSATIYFNLHVCSRKSKDELEEVMIHELTHLLLAPMQSDNGQDNTERCVTMVSRLFKGLRNAK